jgi:hypothetical protein
VEEHGFFDLAGHHHTIDSSLSQQSNRFSHASQRGKAEFIAGTEEFIRGHPGDTEAVNKVAGLSGRASKAYRKFTTAGEQSQSEWPGIGA